MRTCGECALMRNNAGICPIYKTRFSADEGGCPAFTNGIEHCDICGSPILKGGNLYLEDSDATLKIICGNCSQLPKCRLCTHINQCAFEPPFVMQTIQQGNMIMQQQVRNQKRVELTCGKGCPCYHQTSEGDFQCFRDYGEGCRNHKINWRT